MSEPVEPMARHTWTAIGIASAVAAVVALVAGLHFTAEVRLGEGRTMRATSVLALMGSVASVSAFVGRRNPRAGLAGLSLVSIATGGFWLALDRHRFAGPVVLSFTSERGVHLGDPLATLPIAAGLFIAARLRRRPASAGTADRPLPTS